MEQALFLQPTADVSLSEELAIEALRREESAARHVLRHLPIYLVPQADEALISWLSRLARRIGAQLFAVASAASRFLVVDPRRLSEGSWQRPGPNFNKVISSMTGVAVETVRAMTFEDWVPVCRDEGVRGRLGTQFFRMARPADRGMRHFVVCPKCLAGDSEPYVRKTWTLGWVAICGRHSSVMLSACPKCFATFRLPVLSSLDSFRPEVCACCGATLTDAIAHEAHESAIQLQISLLDAKHHGRVTLVGLGVVDWAMAMAAIDALLGMVWIGTLHNHRRKLLTLIADDLGFDPFRRGMADNYGCLLILAWLLDEWPHRLGVASHVLRIARLRPLVDRWPELGSDLRIGFLQKVGNGRAEWLAEAKLRAWLAGVSANELRARAGREPSLCRRVRLLAIADLREGKSVEIIASAIKVKPETIYRWLRQGEIGGLNSVLRRKSEKRLNKTYQAEFVGLISRGFKTSLYESEHRQTNASPIINGRVQVFAGESRN